MLKAPGGEESKREKNTMRRLAPTRSSERRKVRVPFLDITAHNVKKAAGGKPDAGWRAKQQTRRG